MWVPGNWAFCAMMRLLLLLKSREGNHQPTRRIKQPDVHSGRREYGAGALSQTSSEIPSSSLCKCTHRAVFVKEHIKFPMPD
jgi:hypothetical protein